MHIKNKDGKTALIIARDRGHMDIVTLLKEAEKYRFQVGGVYSLRKETPNWAHIGFISFIATFYI